MKSIFLLVLLHANGFFLLKVFSFSLFPEIGATEGRPAIILVPGAFHQGLVYEKVISKLHKAHYYHTTAIDLPSVGAVVGREPDIEAVRYELIKNLEEGRDVLLVGNSYGATVIGEAVKGLENDQLPPRFRSGRHKAGLLGLVSCTARRGRILGLVFFAGYIPYINEVTNPETKPDIRVVAPKSFRFTDDGKVYWDNDLTNEPPEKTFYNDLSPYEQEIWVSRLQFSSFEALAANATYIPYTGDFKCIYVVGSRDNSVPPAWAQTFIDQKGARFEVQRLEADHVPMLSHPDDVVRLIRRAAGDTSISGN